jgi:tetratricopeptide (TPR) repeat protein
MDSLDLLEGRRYGVDGPDVADAYARALMELGRVAQNQRCLDEALVWYQRAEEALESLLHDTRRLEEIALIDGSRRAIASIFGRSGREEQRRRILESHSRMLERLSKNAGGDPAIGLLATLVRLELAADENAIGTLRAAIQKLPANRRLPAILEEKVGVWIASNVNAYPSCPNATGLPMDRLDPDAHADLVIRALESRCKELGVGPSLLSATAYHVGGIAANRCAEQRNSDHLNEARQTAACLSAFARMLARRDPNEAAFHLLLSMAFTQESKNAWKKVPDFTVIEDALRKALGEARTALRLDPRNAEARFDVAVLQDKLVGLPSGRKKENEVNRDAVTISFPRPTMPHPLNVRR